MGGGEGRGRGGESDSIRQIRMASFHPSMHGPQTSIRIECTNPTQSNEALKSGELTILPTSLDWKLACVLQWGQRPTVDIHTQVTVATVNIHSQHGTGMCTLTSHTESVCLAIQTHMYVRMYI